MTTIFLEINTFVHLFFAETLSCRVNQFAHDNDGRTLPGISEGI